MDYRTTLLRIFEELGDVTSHENKPLFSTINPVVLSNPSVGGITYPNIQVVASIIRTMDGPLLALFTGMSPGLEFDEERVQSLIIREHRIWPNIFVNKVRDSDDFDTFDFRTSTEDLSMKGVQESLKALLTVRRAFVDDLRPMVESAIDDDENLDDFFDDPIIVHNVQTKLEPKPEDTQGNSNDPISEKPVSMRDVYSELGRGTIRRAQPHRSAASVLAELDKMIGLQPVKELVKKLAAQQEIGSLRKKAGLKQVVPSPHLVFTGNPGTGKTTIARLIGQLYKSLGLLKTGHVVEVDRSTLIGGYVGQTSLKSKHVFKSAMGGVLFIDEAYALSDKSGNDYGHEAIEALLTFMEEHRNNFAVVVAGYPEPMDSFLDANPGLKSRFDLTIDFPDYSTEELHQMFMNLARDNDYVLDAAAALFARREIDSWERGLGFGNGRDVRKLFNTVVANHALHVSKMYNPTRTTLMRITHHSVPRNHLRSAKVRTASVDDLRAGYL